MTSNFKVIVVGGGPTGLTAAHALGKANIDFVMLERRPNIVIDAGSNLVLAHNGLRILGQLGLHDDLVNVSSSLDECKRLDHQGNKMASMHWFYYLQEKYVTI